MHLIVGQSICVALSCSLFDLGRSSNRTFVLNEKTHRLGTQIVDQIFTAHPLSELPEALKSAVARYDLTTRLNNRQTARQNPVDPVEQHKALASDPPAGLGGSSLSIRPAVDAATMLRLAKCFPDFRAGLDAALSSANRSSN
eukprot:scaffold57609_cov48-Prasinocladus_malaysianus.AAC.1